MFVNCAFAQSALTQIQDTVYNPDGTLFSGTVVISFSGFMTAGTVAPQSTSVQIDTGAFSVVLVPSTTASPGAYYQAIYNSSNGITTWTETWAIPPSTSILTLSQVRISTTEGWPSSGSGSTGSGSSGSSGTGGSSGGGGSITLPIPISDVSGLSAQLNQITTSIAGLTTTAGQTTSTLSDDTAQIATLNTNLNGLSATVTGVTNSVGTVNTTVAGLSTTVSGINGTVSTLGTTVTTLGSTVSTLNNNVVSLSSQVNALSAGSTSAMFTDGETPSGTMDGTNAVFTLSASPSPASSLQLFRNGLAQMSGIDFTLSGNAVTFLNGNVPKSTDILQAFYRVSGIGQTATFVDAETPQGTINGTNLTFTLAAPPNPVLSLKLFKNGMLLAQNADYTLSAGTVTFTTVAATPQVGDSLVAYYRH